MIFRQSAKRCNAYMKEKVITMKVGMRTPSLKKSVKAQTTGKVKRAVKKSVSP